MPLLTLETPYTSKDERRFFSVNSLERNYCRFSDNVADTNAGQMRRSSTASRRRRTSMTSGCFSAARCELDRRSRPSTGWSTTTTRSSWQHGRHGRRVGRRLLEYRHGASYQLRLPVPSTVCSERSRPFCFRAQLLNRLIKLTKFSDSIAEGTHLTSLKQVRRRRYEKSPLFEPQTSLEKKQATYEQTNRQTNRRTALSHYAPAFVSKSIIIYLLVTYFLLTAT